MTDKELREVTREVIWRFNSVKWVHNNLSEELRTKDNIIKIIRIAVSSGLGDEYLQHLINISGNLNVLVK